MDFRHVFIGLHLLWAAVLGSAGFVSSWPPHDSKTTTHAHRTAPRKQSFSSSPLLSTPVLKPQSWLSPQGIIGHIPAPDPKRIIRSLLKSTRAYCWSWGWVVSTRSHDCCALEDVWHSDKEAGTALTMGQWRGSICNYCAQIVRDLLVSYEFHSPEVS